MSDDALSGEPIIAPKPAPVVRTPDEAIMGDGFTLVDAGFFGPVVGTQEWAPVAPPPRTRPEFPPRPRRSPYAEPEPPLQDYMTGFEYPSPGVGGGVLGVPPLKVEEQDGTPSVTGVDLVKVPNGTLSDLGGGDVSLNYESPINKNVASGYAGLDASAPFTQGSVVFANATGLLTQDNANLFFDNAANRLGLGTSAPNVTVDVNGGVAARATTNAQITANQNDYAIGDGSNFRLSTDAQRTITGITGGVDGKFLFISNVGSFNIVLTNQDGASAAANRIITGTGAGRVIAPDQSVILKYDATDQRWRMH